MIFSPSCILCDADAAGMAQLTLFDVHAAAESQPAQSLTSRLLGSLERLFPPLEHAPLQRGEQTAYEFDKAASSFQPFIDEVGGVEDARVLDFGCGWGGETLWLAQQAAAVDGCDVDLSALCEAERQRRRTRAWNVNFSLSQDNALPYPSNHFDLVFSTNAFEHVMQPAAMLNEIYRVLKPGGRLLTRFGPLFYSPLGYHLPWACRVPYAHLVFGLRPILQRRNLKRTPLQATSWAQLGLNQMTYEQFANAVDQQAWTRIRLGRMAVRGHRWMAALPGAGRLFTFGIDVHLQKPTSPGG